MYSPCDVSPVFYRLALHVPYFTGLIPRDIITTLICHMGSRNYVPLLRLVGKNRASVRMKTRENILCGSPLHKI